MDMDTARANLADMDWTWNFCETCEKDGHVDWQCPTLQGEDVLQEYLLDTGHKITDFDD